MEKQSFTQFMQNPTSCHCRTCRVKAVNILLALFATVALGSLAKPSVSSHRTGIAHHICKNHLDKQEIHHRIRKCLHDANLTNLKLLWNIASTRKRLA